jgi:putative ABC transport system ATP-binding protein
VAVTAATGAEGRRGAAIELHDVIRIYREADVETVALRGVDLRVEPGEFVALRGRSGSGKSTLLHLVAGADRPTAGRVVVDGVDLARADERARTALRGRTVGVVFQAGNLVPFLSAVENLELSGALAEQAIGRPEALDLLGRVGLEARAGHRASALSGGEQQRAALACVLAARPSVLVADEITGELDSESAAAVMRLLAEIHRRERVTVLIATHDADVAARASRVVHLVDGRVAEGVA